MKKLKKALRTVFFFLVGWSVHSWVSLAVDNGYASELITVLIVLSVWGHSWTHDRFHKRELMIIDKIRDIFIKMFGKV